MSERVPIADSDESRSYDLSISPEWQNLISHFELAEGFAFIVVIVPDADGVDACAYALEDYLKSKRQEMNLVQFGRPDLVRDIAGTLLHLQVPPETGAIWVSAVPVEASEYNEDWFTAWREGCASLNKFRNHLRDRFDVPILFAGPEWLQVTLREMSPDLWSVRTLVVRIESFESLLSALIENARMRGALELSLAGKGLRQLPDSISQLSLLKKIDLMFNKLSALPESISQLTQLQELYLSNNQLQELPESIGRMTQLQKLDLSGNQLRALPDSIGELSQLHTLYVSYNALTKLPESIGRLPQLRTISIYANRLTKLPESIVRLSQLQVLDVSSNQLKTLPESIGQLSQLEWLALEDNQLTALPESLRHLTSLKTLRLRGNDALGLPPEILGPEGPKANENPAEPRVILEYYFGVRSDVRPLNEARLILVGNGGSGKTSLVNRLVHNTFEADAETTHGLSINEVRLRVGQDDVKLSIWDFGAQEILHTLPQFFFSQRSLYLVVLDGRRPDADADAEYWLRMIESFAGESPVIVVMNRINERPIDLNRRALQQKHPAIREFIETDISDATGVNQLRRSIERETDRLVHVGSLLPANWFAIKDALSAIDKNYITFEEYRKVCVRFDERDENNQEILAGYLHNLGIAFNYRNDSRLRDTVVLNPQWLVNSVDRIIGSEKLSRQKGEFQFQDLSEILDTSEYPDSIRRFIIELMMKFELCFRFPEDADRYLIPELLAKQEPEEAWEFRPEECLSFQYHYAVLPQSLLPRFIVRTHVLSEGQPRWRTGVILRFENNRGLVKADMDEAKVLILISGSLPSRRRLLALIRSDFERIHRSIPNLKVQEMVPLPESSDVMIPYNDLLVMERSGLSKFPKVVKGSVIELDVQELLNGVDIEGIRSEDRSLQRRSEAVRLFCSYSYKDEHLARELETQLKLLQRQGLIESWHDRRIDAGEEWKDTIDENLERADIILLLVTADFLASDYCHGVEIKRALQRHEAGEARVIPVILRAVSWRNAPFAKLQSLPEDGRPVTRWPDRDSAWHNIAEGIERVVKEIRNNKRF